MHCAVQLLEQTSSCPAGSAHTTPDIKQVGDAIRDLRETEAKVENLETLAGKPPRPIAISAGEEIRWDQFHAQSENRNADVAMLQLFIQHQAAPHHGKNGVSLFLIQEAYERIRNQQQNYANMLESIYGQTKKDFDAYCDALADRHDALTADLATVRVKIAEARVAYHSAADEIDEMLEEMKDGRTARKERLALLELIHINEKRLETARSRLEQEECDVEEQLYYVTKVMRQVLVSVGVPIEGGEP